HECSENAVIVPPNPTTYDPQVEHWQTRVEMHRAERQAYSEVLKARVNEFAVGKMPTPNYLLDAHERLCGAIAKENEAIAEYYKALSRCGGTPLSSPTRAQIRSVVAP